MGYPASGNFGHREIWVRNDGQKKIREQSREDGDERYVNARTMMVFLRLLRFIHPVITIDVLPSLIQIGPRLIVQNYFRFSYSLRLRI